MNSKIVLDVKNLRTSFVSDRKEVQIIKGVSFQLKKGTTLALVGESGCGKSVTVHSIVKLMPKNARTVSDYTIYRSYKDGEAREYRLDQMTNYGKQMRNLRGTEISMVFQDPMSSLNPVVRIGDQIIEGLLEHEKISKKEAMDRAVELLRKLGIPDPEQCVKRYPHELSGGMKQRIIIAIAMICDPEVIIADEPTTALDVTIQAQIMELMKRLQTEFHKSIILITHNMGLVTEMADEVCVMYMGKVVEFGKILDIFEHPSHPYTKALLKSVPVLGMEKGRGLETIPGNTPNPADLGEGCAFADRCQECRKECRTEAIPVYEIAEGHQVRCIKYQAYKEVE